MKKFAPLALLLALGVFVGCEKKPAETPTAPAGETAPAAETPAAEAPAEAPAE